MGKINSRAKGARGEHEMLDLYIEKLNLESKDFRTKRNFQGGEGGGRANGDFRVKGFERFHFEMKNKEILAIPEWWEQTMYDANHGHNTKPVLHFKMPRHLRDTPRKKFYVVVEDLEDYCLNWLQQLGFEVKPGKNKYMDLVEHLGKEKLFIPKWIKALNEGAWVMVFSLKDRELALIDFDYIEEVAEKVAMHYGWEVTK